MRVYTYKDPELLKKECEAESVHRAGEVEIYSLDPKFLRPLAKALKRDNPWTVIHNDSELMITVGEENFMGTLGRHGLES